VECARRICKIWRLGRWLGWSAPCWLVVARPAMCEGITIGRKARASDWDRRLCGTRPSVDFLLGFRLHVVGDDKPTAVDLLVDVGDDVVDLLVFAVLHLRSTALLAHLPREIAVGVNVLV
jgi:hypothetical protein